MCACTVSIHLKIFSCRSDWHSACFARKVAQPLVRAMRMSAMSIHTPAPPHFQQQRTLTKWPQQQPCTQTTLYSWADTCRSNVHKPHTLVPSDQQMLMADDDDFGTFEYWGPFESVASCVLSAGWWVGFGDFNNPCHVTMSHAPNQRPIQFMKAGVPAPVNAACKGDTPGSQLMTDLPIPGFPALSWIKGENDETWQARFE